MKKTAIHIIFWLLMIISALCKFNYENIEVSPVITISTYLGSILILALVLFYIGYGFAYKFLDSKRRFLNIGIVVFSFIFLIIVPTIIRGIEPFTVRQLLSVGISNFIDHFAWFVGGIISRHFFDSTLFVKK